MNTPSPVSVQTLAKLLKENKFDDAERILRQVPSKERELAEKLYNIAVRLRNALQISQSAPLQEVCHTVHDLLPTAEELNGVPQWLIKGVKKLREKIVPLLQPLE